MVHDVYVIPLLLAGFEVVVFAGVEAEVVHEGVPAGRLLVEHVGEGEDEHAAATLAAKLLQAGARVYTLDEWNKLKYENIGKKVCTKTQRASITIRKVLLVLRPTLSKVVSRLRTRFERP